MMLNDNLVRIRLEFFWRNWEKPQYTSVRIAGPQIEDWSQNLPDTRLEVTLLHSDFWSCVRRTASLDVMAKRRSRILFKRFC